MPKQVLFIQGGGKAVHNDWDDKLVTSLIRALGPDYDVRYPVMPHEDDPHFNAWKMAILAGIDKLDDGAVLVGHSIGAAVLISAITDAAKRKFGGIFLLSPPFIGDGGWPSDEIPPMVGLGQLLPQDTPVYLYHGFSDDIVPPAHADLYQQAIPGVIVHRLAGRNHQLDDDLTEVAADILALT